MSTAGGASSLEGGVGGGGGKMRRRTSRRTAATPYDRPALAPVNPGASNGWLSKLVDPASRLITVGASRIFHSVFGRRGPLPLAAPPSDVNHQSGNDFAEPVAVKSSFAEGEAGNVKGGCTDTKPENDGISKVEQLLMQKTFTRDEIDHLNGILRSRTLDVFADEVNTRAAIDEKKRFEAATSQPIATHEAKEKIMPAKIGVGNSALFGSVSTGSKVLEDEAASPCELAKAYMGTRPLRISPTTLGWRTQALRRDPPMFNNIQFTPKPSNRSLTPKPTGHIYDNGYLTPRTQGRSAIYNMARSPYARFPSPAVSKNLHVQDDGYAGQSTSLQRTHINNLQLSDRQMLKRRSLVLDNNSGYGPIRRVRQKSNLTIPLKDTDSYICGNALPIPLTPVHSDTGKSLPLDALNCNTSYGQIKENGDGGISAASYSSVPSQSSETARKIFLHLETMTSSPKEKSSEMKLANARREPPSTLTSNMLNERALKSMEEIESPKLKTTSSSDGSLDLPVGGTNLLGPGLSLPQSNKKAEENGVAEIVRGSKSSYDVNGFANSIYLPMHTASSSKVGNSNINSAANQPHIKRGFQMKAPEDYPELDDDGQNSKAQYATAGTEKETHKDAAVAFADVGVAIKVPMLSSDSKKFDYKLDNGADVAKKALDPPIVAEKETGFTFPATSTNRFSASAFGQTSFFNKADMQKEKTSDKPIISFSGKSIDKGTIIPFSSSTNNASITSGLKFGAGFDHKPELLSSNAAAFVRQSESITFDKEWKNQNEVESSRPPESFKPLGSSVISGSSNVNNGALAASTSAFSVSSTAAVFTFGSGSGTVTSSTVSLSSSATPAISSAESIKFGPASAPPSNLFSMPPGTRLSDVEIKTNLATPISSSLSTSTSTFSNASSLLGSGAAAHSDGTGTLSANNQAQSSCSSFDASTGSLFENSEAPSISQSAGSQSGVSSALSPTFGLNNSSLSGSATTLFQTSGSAPLFSSAGPTSSMFGGSGSQLAGSTTIGLFNSSSQPVSTAATTSLFGLSSQSASSTITSIFGSSPQISGSGSSVFGSNSQSAASTNMFGSNSLPATSIGVYGSSSQPASNTGLFGTSSQPATGTSLFVSQPAANSSVFGSQPVASSIFGTVTSTLPSTGFSFSASSGNGSLAFGSSSTGASSGPSMFFTSNATATSSSGFSLPSPAFSIPSQPVSFGPTSPSNDQMNVEDSMAEDTFQASNVPSSPLYGQVANAPPSSTPLPFVFGTPTVPSGGAPVFQFGGHPNPSTPQTPSPFSPPGVATGSFSLGAGGTDKSSRRIVKVRRDKVRKK